MAVKVTDGDSPGRFDALDWKWFAAGTVELDDVVGMTSLCDRGPKVMLEGNLVVHATPPKRTTASEEGSAVVAARPR